MPFSDRTKLVSLAIVHTFETAKPFGDYSAVAVLDDGAGISYGVNQFTHRSGSLYSVVNTYLGMGGTVGAVALDAALPAFRDKSAHSIDKLSKDANVKDALRRAGHTPEMHQAQQQIMENMYLLPAIDACEGSHFDLPLSLAVIYDSKNHGSYDKIRDRVSTDRSNFPNNTAFEKAWIKDYCHERLAWLGSAHGSLKNTVYRPQTFLDLIEKGNWNLDPPLEVRVGKGRLRLPASLFQNSAADPLANPTSDNASPAAADAVDEPAVPRKSETVDTITEGQPPDTSTTRTIEEKQIPGGTKTTETKEESFNPSTITQIIPRIVGSKRWFGGLSVGGIIATAGAAFAGMPPWVIFMLGVLTGIIITCFAFILIRYKSQLFDLVKAVIKINADPTTNNIQLLTKPEAAASPPVKESDSAGM